MRGPAGGSVQSIYDVERDSCKPEILVPPVEKGKEPTFIEQY